MNIWQVIIQIYKIIQYMYMQYTISKGRLLVTTAWFKRDYTERAASSGKGQIKMERRGREERGEKQVETG